MFKIGYVDEDPKEVRKFDRALSDDFEIVTYEIPKALPKKDLIDQIYNSQIDLLLVDYLMRDKGHLTYNGDSVVREFEEIKPNFPMIIFTNNENDAFPQVDDVNIIYDKSIIKHDKAHFVEIIKKNIALYQNYIQTRKDKIANLFLKREKEELTPKEKDELFSSQLELSRLDLRMNQESPNHILSETNLDHLAEITNKAEELLNYLQSKRK